MVSMTVREALRDAMAEEMRRDPAVFVMGEEVGEYQGAYKVTQGLLDEFGPTRVVDTPITEYGFAGVGVGAAFAGLKPIVEFMTWNFAMQAIDHIINSAAKTLYMSGGKMHCPIVFRGPNGAAARVAAQHSQNYAAWYAHVPGLKVIAPYTAADAKGLLKAAIRDPGPVVFLENEILYGQSFEVPKLDDFVIPIGKARIARTGKDVTIVSFSRGMAYALDAAKHLAEEGIEAEVIDLRTLRPLDIETVLASVRKTNRIVTVEEGWPVCSIASEIAARVTAEAFDHLDAPPLAVTGADVPMPYAANLEKLALPSVEQVDRSGEIGLLPELTPMAETSMNWKTGRVPLRRGALRGAGARRDRGQGVQLLDLPHDRLSASHRRERALPPRATAKTRSRPTRFNTGTAKHHFCSVCGIKSFYVPRSKPDGFSVNVRCLDDGQVRVTSIALFDGQHWEEAFAAAQGQGLSHADANPHAAAFAHHGGGQARRMACEGGRSRSGAATWSPRSRPTRRPWRSRRPRTA